MPTSLALVVVGWIVGWWLFGRPKTLPQLSAPVDAAVAIDVVIPARNEAAQLPRLLAALDQQSHPPASVVVVDDESADDTTRVASAAGATVIAAGPTPTGWMGKSWACWQGAAAGSADLIVFLDADTDPQPDLLAQLAAEHDRGGGLVSVQPFHRMVQRRERLAAIFNIVAIMGVGCGRSENADVETNGAFGPCLACSRSDYDEVGGHRSIAASVIDDFALAQRFRSKDKRVANHIGSESVDFRMYPTGTKALIEGFAKNFASGAGSIPLRLSAGIALWVAALLSPALMMLGIIGGGLAVGAVAYALVVVQMHVFLRQLGNFGVAAAVLHPLLLLAFAGIFGWSVVRFARGSVRWKGRTVQLRGERS